MESARRLLHCFGSPQAVFEASGQDWQGLLNSSQITALSAPTPNFDQQLEKTWAWLQAGEGRDLLLLGDPDYPEALLQTADPPLLFVSAGATRATDPAQPGHRRQPQPDRPRPATTPANSHKN